MDAPTLRETMADAIRYWEPLRIGYNLVLAIVVLLSFWIGYPASKAALSGDLAQFVFILAVLANVAYCAVYPVDVFAQFSGYRDLWRKYRWVLFVIGMLFAGIITHFFSIGLFSGAGN
jgi:hypothetical protein